MRFIYDYMRLTSFGSMGFSYHLQRLCTDDTLIELHERNVQHVNICMPLIRYNFPNHQNICLIKLMFRYAQSITGGKTIFSVVIN